MTFAILKSAIISKLKSLDIILFNVFGLILHILQNFPFPLQSISLVFAFYCQMFATSETQQEPADKHAEVEWELIL